MQCRVADLRCKEVINICDGLRLGFICDIQFSTTSGRILAIVVPGQARLFGLLGHEDDYVIPWECIRRLGDDIVLVELNGEYRREKRSRRKWFC
jgi:YlmC/YmxH family sporulation protein